MHLNTRLGWLAATVFSLAACAAFGADFGGTYSAPKIKMQLVSDGEGYTGSLTINDAKYPVTAKESAGALAGTFTSQGKAFDFTAKLDGAKLTIATGGKSYELQREPREPVGPVNPFDQLPPGPATQPAATQPAATQPAQGQPPAGGGMDAQLGEGQTGPTGDAAIAALKNLSPVQPDPKRDWLMLVYLDGDNNLDMQGAFNISQMERGLPETGVEVIVLYDRPIKKTKEGYLTHPNVYRVRRGPRTDVLNSPVLKPLGAINIADPKVLAAFIEGAVKAFPAKQYALFTWNHGGGWATMNVDENAPGKPNNHDSMDLPKLRAGLTEGMRAAGLKKWDIIAFDMCLMSQLEVAAEVHDLADVMVASQAEEPGKGMPYTRVLEALGKGTLGGRRIGVDIVTEYDKFHKEDGERSTTMAALDLSQFNEVNAKLNAVADKLAAVMPKAWTAVARSYFYAEQYSNSRDDFRNGKGALQSVDLMDALKKIRSATADFPAEAEYKSLVQAMDRFVIASANSERRRMSNGVAIYAPVIKDAYNAEYEKINFARVSTWPRLLRSLYPEQAKDNQPPKFGKIQLVDVEDKPIETAGPLAGNAVAFEVDGKNMIWVRHMTGIRDPAFNGVRTFVVDYLVDPNFVEKVSKGVEKHALDVDLIMPQLADGNNKLKHSINGLIFLASNGEKALPVMIDNSDLREPTSFTVPVLLEHASLGEKPVKAILHADAANLSSNAATLVQTDQGGRTVLRRIQPPADAKVTPLFWLYKDDNTRELCAKESFTWNKGLHYKMDLMPAADYEEIFVAETMTGAATTARFRYKGKTDDALVQSKTSFQNVKSEQLVGSWEWMLVSKPPKSIGVKMTLEPMKAPFAYKVTLDSPLDDGKRKVDKGILVMDLDHLPFFRMILIPEGRGRPETMLGTAWWAPEGNTARILTRNLAMDLNILWVKTGGGGGGGGELVKEDRPATPEGWKRFTDTQRMVSVAVPPDFAPNPQAVLQLRGVFPGYDFLALDPVMGAGVEIIRFDGIKEPDAALRALLAGAQRLRIQTQLGQAQNAKIDGVDVTSYQGQNMNPDGSIVSIGINLIPTPKGIVAVDFVCSPRTVEVVVPTLQKILQTIQVAR